MKKNIITLGRQFGSGGKDIGMRLSSLLEMKFYDKEILFKASETSGIDGEFFNKADESTPTGFMGAMSFGFPIANTMFPFNDYLSNESLFSIQSDTILDIANSGNCVLVGRCADYILRGFSNVIKIFVCADMEDRIKRILDLNDSFSREDAAELIITEDKKRAEYYNYYTDKKWGDACSYDIIINSSLLGVEETSLWLKNAIDIANQ